MRTPWHPAVDELKMDQVLSALGDPVRLDMVRLLADGEEHARGEFDYGLAQSTLSHHAKTLREAGLVRARNEGTRCFMSLRPDFEDRFPGLLDAILDLSADGSVTARR